jgi:hypothetical protein
MCYHSATSVDIEHNFSDGRRLLSFTRNWLSTPSIQRFMYLGSWCDKNLVSTKILMKALITSPKRPAVLEPEEDTEADAAVNQIIVVYFDS